MDYVQRIIEDFRGKNTFQAWAIMSRKMAPNNSRTLVHPSSMTKEQIKELIPPRFNVEEILGLLPAKQKEIAGRIDISKLPRDRPPGLLGQAALFEVLRDKGFDFKSYLDHFYRNWDYGGPKPNALIFLLGYIYYIRRFFRSPKIDLVKIFLAPQKKHQLALVWDENWVTRIFVNSTKYIPNNLTNKHIHQIVTKLMCLQDGMGMTVPRVMKWTGEPRAEASHLMDIIRSSWVEHRYRIVSKNTDTVKVLTKSKASSKIVPSFHSSCKSFLDNEEYFISMSDMFRKDVDGKHLELEAWNTNIDLFDTKDKRWKLSPSCYSARTVEDIYSLLKTGDHKLPNNDILPTRRDIVFIALLIGMETSHHLEKRQEIIRMFTKGCGVPKDEAENGIRNVLRKNMVRNQYTHYGIADFEREFFTIIFDDKSNKTIPFLGEVLPNIMWSWLQTDAQMGYGLIFASLPSYMSSDLRSLIESSMSEHDVNGELFLLHSWSYGQPGSILQLVANE
jgi:hypothetical protein